MKKKEKTGVGTFFLICLIIAMAINIEYYGESAIHKTIAELIPIFLLVIAYLIYYRKLNQP